MPSLGRSKRSASAKTTATRSPRAAASSSTVKAVVLFDRYRWLDDNDELQSAGKGDTIEVSADEFRRGKDLGALAKPGKDAEAAQTPQDAPLTKPDGTPVDEDQTGNEPNGSTGATGAHDELPT